MRVCEKSPASHGQGRRLAEDRVRVVLVEDDERFGELLAAALDAAADILLVGRASTLAEGLWLLDGRPADVMLVDLGLPDGNGVDLIRAARRAWPSCEIMVSTIFGDEASVIRSIEAGARGYLLKDCPPARMVEEIRSLHAGGSPISPRVARHVLLRLVHSALPAAADEMESGRHLATGTSESPTQVAGTVPGTGRAGPAPVLTKDAALSTRELEVLQHITRGFTHDEIANKMNLSRHTVLTFVRRIYAKLEVRSKIEAINKARGKGLISN
jgi:DNA-binding NarL/FixJ family response regulator